MKIVTCQIILEDIDKTGKKRERRWEEIAAEEREQLGEILEECAMKAAGYHRAH